ncbi:MAG: CPBP family intramembrane metalloprotease [Caldilinea sp. CFX5]|nr:CPBP family intramembrane metalloprotease [Caldilinea sp. CFX5]
MELGNFIRRNVLSVYFVLAFAITWGGILLIVGVDGLQPASSRTMQSVLLLFLAMLIGPSLTGVGLTVLLDGKEGWGALLARWRHWPAQPQWYAVALLTTTLLLLVIGGLLSFVSPVFVPSLIASHDKLTVLTFALVIGVLAGFFEEIGWSGFATPRLLKQHNVLTTGLLLGALWGTWHLLADYWGNAGVFGTLYPMRGLLWVVTLTAYRILMVWVYSKTSSLGLMQLMHAGFTGGQALWEPPLPPTDYLLWYGLFSAALWLLVILLIRFQFARQPRKQPDERLRLPKPVH